MVTITEKAANEIKRVLTEQQLPIAERYLRVGVRGGGCSGFDYDLGFDQSADQAQDFISEQHGVRVAVNKQHDLYLDGTEIDFIDTLKSRGFKFNNPNATKTCGCGQSFGV